MHRVAVESSAGLAVVEAGGELDAYTAGDLRAALAEAMACSRVVVDLGSASFLDSTALGVVIRAMRDIDEAGGVALVVLPRGPARRIFEITTLDKVLPLADSRDDAIERLAAGAA